MSNYDDFLDESGFDRVPGYLDRRYTKNMGKISKPVYEVKKEEDVEVVLRDGTKIYVDIYRPDTTDDEKSPSLIAWSAYGKSMQYIKRGTIPPKSLLFDHSLEAGDVDFFVKRGYTYIIPDPRGIGKSEGEFLGVYNPQEQEDVYDLIEWAAVQNWCTSDVSLIGYSYFGIIQALAAAKQPPHLKCIMPLSFSDDYYQHGYYGGVGTTYLSIYWELCPSNNPVPWSEKIYSEEEFRAKIEELKKNPDIAVNSYFSKILNTWPARYHTYFLDVLLHSLDGKFWQDRSAGKMYQDIKVPMYIKCGWSPNGRWSAGALRALNNNDLNVPKRVGVMEGYGGMTLPYRYMNEEQLRWYDHWLKGIDTGIMDEPPLKINIFGAGFRYEKEWPLARTEWKKLYLHSWNKLKWEPDAEKNVTPDSLVHVPPNVTAEVPSLTYRTDPFTRPMEFTGPVTLNINLSIDAEDANLLAYLWVILPNGQKHPVSRYGALKLSHPYIAEESKPWEPVHDHTRRIPVKPGEINEYVVEINPMGWVINPGQAIELEIKAMDPHPHQQDNWIGKVGNTGVIPSANTIHYRVYRDAEYQSHLLMPLIPAGSTSKDQWLQPID